jgi:hypothetical protein
MGAMSDFDHAAAFATQADPAAVVGRLLAVTGERLHYRDWFITRAIPLPGGPKRTPDLVAILDHPDKPARAALLILELQSSHDPEKLDTTLVEVAVFRAYARHGKNREHKYRVFCGLVYLKGECPEAVLDMALAGGFGTRHRPLLWEVEKDDADAALAAVAEGKKSWGLLFWIALMTGADKEATIARWRELVSDPARVASPWMRQNLVTVALFFAQLAGRFLIWERALEGLGMGESIVGDRFRAQGEVRAKRAWLVRLLTTKYPAEFSAEVRQLVEQQADLALLNQWFEDALQAKTFEDFVQKLK